MTTPNCRRDALNRDDIVLCAGSSCRVRHRGGHTSVYNSMALGLADAASETQDPPGGRFYRDENGRLTGLVAGGARAVFSELIPSDSTREQRRDGVMLISELMTQAGLTSVHQTGGYGTI